MKYSYTVVHTVHNVHICKYCMSSACSIWLLLVMSFLHIYACECRPASLQIGYNIYITQWVKLTDHYQFSF